MIKFKPGTDLFQPITGLDQLSDCNQRQSAARYGSWFIPVFAMTVEIYGQHHNFSLICIGVFSVSALDMVDYCKSYIASGLLNIERISHEIAH